MKFCQKYKHSSNPGSVGRLTLALALLSTGLLSGQSNIKVEGMGFFANRSLDARLAFLQGYEPDEVADLDAVALEDSAFLLLEQVKREGYLRPVIEGNFATGEDTFTARWGPDYEIQLPIDGTADSALFHIEPGVFYYYADVELNELAMMPESEAKRYFIPGGVLFGGQKARMYTPENLERRVQRWLQSLQALGYRSVRIEAREVDMNHSSGAVRVRLAIAPGPMHEVGELEYVISEPGEPDRVDSYPVEPGVAYTREWERGVREALLNAAYAAGYPDAELRLEDSEASDTHGGARRHDLRFRLARGSQVQLENVRFAGDPDTRRSVLRRQVDLVPGDALNRLDVAEGRRKLMGLGIFNAVDSELQPKSGQRRDAVYTLTPAERKELRLRVGWGSYELARAGIEWAHRNPFGRAHRYKLGLKQSFKASRAAANYTMPRVLGAEINSYANIEYSSRDEISYDQSKIGGSVGLSQQLPSGLQLAMEYGVFRDEVERSDISDFIAETNATVASVELSASLDRRDNFLSPNSGYSLLASYQLAGSYLGGDVDFQKAKLGGTLHFSLTDSLVVHSGLQWGTIFSTNGAADDIPFGERFFTGGEDSVRGYQQGEASPLDGSGHAIGAETYLLGNFELAQRLMEQVSVVLFLDAVWHARDGFFEDEVDVLTTAGLGLRYHTPVGPLRVEYGHNLNPREPDPAGTFHFSIGFPF